MKEYAKNIVGEALGLFIITFTSCGAIMVDALSGGGVGSGGVALVAGLSYGVAILALGQTCRCHFNPVLSIGFTIFGKVSPGAGAGAIVGQIMGAFVAVGILILILGDVAALGASFPAREIAQVAEVDPLVLAATLEGVIGGILMFVALSVSTQGRLNGITAAVAIGATVTLLTLFAGPLDGAPMNPARSLAPAVIGGNMENLWIYLVLPVLGGLVGGGLHGLLGLRGWS